MQLQAAHAGFGLLAEGKWVRVVAFARDTVVEGERVNRLEHLTDMRLARCAGRRVGAGAVHVSGANNLQDVVVVTDLGPVPPPSMVVIPDAIAS